MHYHILDEWGDTVRTELENLDAAVEEARRILTEDEGDTDKLLIVQTVKVISFPRATEPVITDPEEEEDAEGEDVTA